MNLLREPRVGIHSVRVFDVAIVDLVFTALLAIVISRKKFIIVFTILILLSIVVHTIMGIKTQTNKWLLRDNTM